MQMIFDQSRDWDKIIPAFAQVDSEPEKQVIDFLESGPVVIGKHGIDIGCGSGRHSLEAVRRGYGITAVDWSDVACLGTLKSAALHGYRIAVRRARMECLPFGDDKFDFAICWSVLNHGTRKSFEEGLTEAFRVLRQGGLLFGCIMTDEDQRFGQGIQIEQDCFAFTRGLESGIVHYFPEKSQCLSLLRKYGAIEEAKDVEFSGDDIAAYHPDVERSCHLQFLVRKTQPGKPGRLG